MVGVLILLTVSCLAGVLGGLTGTGGILIPPVMIEFLGSDPHVAMGSAQTSFFLPSLLAVLMFRRHGDLNWDVAIPMSIGGLFFSFVGANIKPYISASFLTVLLALCIMAAGALMLSQRQIQPSRQLGPTQRWRVLLGLGALVGLMAGVTGSGSSAVLVPIMVYLGIDVLSVLAACQFYSVLVSLSGTAGNLMHNAVDLTDAMWLAIGQLGGIYVGVRMAQRMETSLLKRCVGLICLLTGLFMIGKVILL